MYVRIAGGGGDDDCKTDGCCKIGREEGSRAEQSRGRKEGGRSFVLGAWSFAYSLATICLPQAPYPAQSVSQSVDPARGKARPGQSRVVLPHLGMGKTITRPAKHSTVGNKGEYYLCWVMYCLYSCSSISSRGSLGRHTRYLLPCHVGPHRWW